MNRSIVFPICRLDSNLSDMIVISRVRVDNQCHFPLRSSVLVIEFQNQITNFDIFPRSKPFIPWQKVRCKVLDPTFPEFVHFAFRASEQISGIDNFFSRPLSLGVIGGPSQTCSELGYKGPTVD